MPKGIFYGDQRLANLVNFEVSYSLSVFPVELFPHTSPAVKGLDGQYSGKQGQVLVVTVKGEVQATEVTGTFLTNAICPPARPSSARLAPF